MVRLSPTRALLPVAVAFHAAAALVVGCSFDWSTAPLDASDASSEHAATDPPDGDPSDAADEMRADASHDAGAADACDASDATQASDAGFCDPGHPCSDGGYCVYADHYCGSGQTKGTCAPAPTTCADASVGPVCACDTNVDLSSCAAAQRNVDVSRQAACSTPSGEMRCGYRYCKASSEACVQQGDDFRCISLGACVLGCTCTGVLNACAGESCSVTNGNVYVTCP